MAGAFTKTKKASEFRSGADSNNLHFLSSNVRWQSPSLVDESAPVVGSGGNQPILVEQSDAIKTYLARWKSVKLNLTELARLRWIQKLNTPALCVRLKRKRTAIRQSIRTIRNCELKGLELSPEERKQILKQIRLEEKSYGTKERKHVSHKIS